MDPGTLISLAFANETARLNRRELKGLVLTYVHYHGVGHLLRTFVRMSVQEAVHRHSRKSIGFMQREAEQGR